MALSSGIFSTSKHLAGKKDPERTLPPSVLVSAAHLKLIEVLRHQQIR